MNLTSIVLNNQVHEGAVMCSIADGVGILETWCWSHLSTSLCCVSVSLSDSYRDKFAIKNFCATGMKSEKSGVKALGVML